VCGSKGRKAPYYGSEGKRQVGAAANFCIAANMKGRTSGDGKGANRPGKRIPSTGAQPHPHWRSPSKHNLPRYLHASSARKYRPPIIAQKTHSVYTGRHGCPGRAARDRYYGSHEGDKGGSAFWGASEQFTNAIGHGGIYNGRR
jgi:hypothetical protein